MAEQHAGDERPDGEAAWEAGWEGHEQAQLERFARLSLAEKIDWLEQAQQLVLQLQQQSEERPAAEPEPPPATSPGPAAQVTGR